MNSASVFILCATISPTAIFSIDSQLTDSERIIQAEIERCDLWMKWKQTSAAFTRHRRFPFLSPLARQRAVELAFADEMAEKQIDHLDPHSRTNLFITPSIIICTIFAPLADAGDYKHM